MTDTREDEAGGEHDHQQGDEHERALDDVVKKNYREVDPDGNEVEGEEVTEVEQQDHLLEAVRDEVRVIGAEQVI